MTRALLFGAVVVLSLPVAAFAQQAATEEGSSETPVKPRAANPGEADAPKDLERESGLAAEEGSAAAPASTGENPVAPPVAPETAPAPAPAVAEPIVPATPAPAPASEVARDVSASPASVKFEGLADLSAALSASVRASYQGATPFPMDAAETQARVAPLMTRVRVTPEIHWARLALVGEADVATGAIVGNPDASLVGTRVPYPDLAAVDWRKGYLQYRWDSGAFRVGRMTSQWGLGLLANDGNADPVAGEFGQQQFGNLTNRALLAVRPLFNLGGAARAFETALAADLIHRDTFGDFDQGDRAFQGVAAVRFAKDNDNQFGVYAVYRSQRNIFVTDGGKATDVVVVDFAGKWQLVNKRRREVAVGWELVGINGTTTQARNENAEKLAVAEFGAAFKSKYRVGRTSFYFDMGYASGDQNPADDRVENFRMDRDFKVGLVLFDQVLAYQSARASVRASDPGLTGTPPEGADLLGTGGGVTGAAYLFPRLKVGLNDWLDLYGGPLFAWTTARLTDPFNTRLQGGTSVNSLGAPAGSYLGTEVDLGVQARFSPVREITVTATGEGGLLLPGSAFAEPGGGVMAPVGFGRLRLAVNM